MGEEVSSQISEDGFKDGDAHEADDEHVEGGQRSVHQHFVDDDLKEERRNKAEQLQEEGCSQDFGKEPSVIDDGGYEPFETEGNL